MIEPLNVAGKANHSFGEFPFVLATGAARGHQAASRNPARRAFDARLRLRLRGLGLAGVRLLLSGLHLLLLLPGHLLLLLLVLLLQSLRLLLVLLLQLLLPGLVSLLLCLLLVFLLLLLLELRAFLRLLRVQLLLLLHISGPFRRSRCWGQVCEEWAEDRWDELPCWGEERCSRAGQPDCSEKVQPGSSTSAAAQPQRCSQAGVEHCSEAGPLASEYWPWADWRHDSEEEECMALQTVWQVLRQSLGTPRAWELPQ